MQPSATTHDMPRLASGNTLKIYIAAAEQLHWAAGAAFEYILYIWLHPATSGAFFGRLMAVAM